MFKKNFFKHGWVALNILILMWILFHFGIVLINSPDILGPGLMLSAAWSVEWIKDLLFNQHAIEFNAVYLIVLLAISVVSCVLYQSVMLKMAQIILFYIVDAQYFYVSDSGSKVLLSILALQLIANIAVKLDLFKDDLLLLLIKIQIGVIYTSSSLLKIQSESWRNGDALMYLIKNPNFHFPASFHDIDMGLLAALSVLVVCAQLSFLIYPFMYKYGQILNLCGIAFHLLIMLLLGVVTFSLLMIMLHIFLFYYGKSSFLQLPGLHKRKRVEGAT